MKTVRLKDYIIPNLLILPVILRWLLPWGMELRLYMNFNGVYFFIPDLLYVVYILNHRKLHVTHRLKSTNALLLIIGILYLYSIIHLLFSESTGIYKLNVIFNSFSFVNLPLIFLLWPLNANALEKTKIPLIFTLLVICGEVILYSTGILTYTTAEGKELTEGLNEMGGIIRISTTVGAATGTAIIILLLGCIVTGYFSINRIFRYFIFIFVTITLLLTVSRGSILTWVLYIMFSIWTEMKSLSLKRNFMILMVLFVSIYFMNEYGFFDPLKYRMDNVRSDITTGREDLNNEAWGLVQSSNYMGVGAGHVYPEGIVQYLFTPPYSVGVHNTYLIILVELGIFGFLLYVVMYLFFLKPLKITKSPLAFISVCALVINFYTEPVFINQGSISPFLLLLNVAYEKQLYSQASKTPNGNQRGGLPYTEQEGYFM